MLSEIQFQVLNSVYRGGGGKALRQRDLSESLDVSLGKINACCKDLRQKGLLGADMRLTDAAFAALEPYKVKNAVIMAAGMSSRFAPLSYEKPKSLLVVKGEVLIERQIRQLQEAGVTNITVVVGYMKEKMFYLADKLGVELVINPDYYRYNNTSTLLRVADRLGQTYICSSDNYFTENVFELYVYRSFYAAEFAPGPTQEWCMQCSAKGLIQQVTVGGSASWYMMGHAYFSQELAERFVSILRAEYDSPVTRARLWEDLYVRHIAELPLYVRPYPRGTILEFDSLEELRGFDDGYITNVDSRIFRNIKKTLDCADTDIAFVKPLKDGMTNISFVFSCRGKQYVYRHPGAWAGEYIDRASEAIAMDAAKSLGLDSTYVHMDAQEGWKISEYVADGKNLDYHNKKQVDKALGMIRRLHDARLDTPYAFDLRGRLERFAELIQKRGRADFDEFFVLLQNARRLLELTEADNVPKCLCHCDFCDTNTLVGPDGKIYLFDWEYAGLADPACDLATFISCADYTPEEAADVLRRYLGHKPAAAELRHQFAYVSLLSYYWFLWALYQDSIGKAVGEFLYIWYKYAKLYGRTALELYEAQGKESL